MKVLFTGCTFNEETIKKLKEKNIEVINGRTDYTEQELIEKLKDVDCYINGGDEICTSKVIEENKHLRLISFMGTGYQKYIDVPTAKKYNIQVSYTPSANAKTVAEYAVALILDCVKKITYSNNQVKNKQWEKIKTFNLEGKTLGIVGMGAIGTHITKILCDGFGMNLIYNSQSEKEEINKKYNTKEVWLLYPINEDMPFGKTITFESENDVRVNVYFVDVSRIDDSITYLRNVIERETPQ